MLRHRLYLLATALILAGAAQAYSGPNSDYGQCYVYCNSTSSITTTLEGCCNTLLQCPEGGFACGQSWFPDPGSSGNPTPCPGC
jgi:hypothetical protein